MKKGYELVNFCEFDKYASTSYCAIHGVDESLNLGDITKVDETKLKPFNMIVGGSPCQDFSVAGKQNGSVWKCKNEDCKEEYNPLTVHYSERHKCPKCGSEDLDKSRSSLLVEWLRVIRHNKPNFGIYENVKNIVGKQFKETTFRLFEEELNEYGYNTYWQVLNAKDYGVPQNRERVFLILIKKELDNGKFKFPEKMPLELRLKDILEDEVEEKYYINREWHFTQEHEQKHDTNEVAQVDGIEYKATRSVTDPDKICRCLDTMGGGQREPKIMVVAPEPIKHEQESRIYSKEGISPALAARDGKGAKKIVCDMKENYVQYDLSGKGHNSQDQRAFYENGVHGTLPSSGGESKCKVLESNYRIRKLTPLECWRLMGFDDTDIDRAKKAGLSNSQLYKQAGNSIVTDCLYNIARELYIAMPYLFKDLKLSSYFSGIGAFEKALDRLFEEIHSGNFTQPQEN